MRVGVLGGGQLGRMLAQAGASLGHSFHFFDSNPDACAQEFGSLTVGAFDDNDALDRFAANADVVTCEFENVPAESLERISDRVEVFPSAESFRVAQDRLREKLCFASCGVDVGAYASVETLDEAIDAVSRLGAPGLLKARSGGYDGKGQARIQTAGDVERAWDEIYQQAALYERLVQFDRELSIVGVRSKEGHVVCYPLVENVHKDGILIATRAPAPSVSEEMRETSERYFRTVSERLGHVGVMAIELFDCGGTMLANEMAPRVHNTGHWTIEGSDVSQFENHIRSVTGMELGSPCATGHTLMLNVLGSFLEKSELEVAQGEGVGWHGYAKRPRPGRKVGHVTLRGASPEELSARVNDLDPGSVLCERIPGLAVAEQLLGDAD